MLYWNYPACWIPATPRCTSVHPSGWGRDPSSVAQKWLFSDSVALLCWRPSLKGADHWGIAAGHTANVDRRTIRGEPQPPTCNVSSLTCDVDGVCCAAVSGVVCPSAATLNKSIKKEDIFTQSIHTLIAKLLWPQPILTAGSRICR